MSKLDELPIYIKAYKLQKYLYLLIKNFKKEYKYTLGQSILDSCMSLLDEIITINTAPNHKKAEAINSASSSFDKLKLRLRIAHELKLISNRQYSYILPQNEEIGKMLAGWYSWALKQKNAKA